MKIFSSHQLSPGLSPTCVCACVRVCVCVWRERSKSIHHSSFIIHLAWITADRHRETGRHTDIRHTDRHAESRLSIFILPIIYFLKME